MPRIKGQDKSYWDSISTKAGDFLEDKLMNPDEYFVNKYGDKWESKRDSARKNVRSLYGLIPQDSKTATKDAIISALAFMIGRPAGVQMFRGVTKPGKTMIRGGHFRGSPDYEGNIFGTQSPFIGSGYQQGKHFGKIAERHVAGAGWAPDDFMNLPIPGRGSLVEFDLPKSFMDLYARGGPMWRQHGRWGGYWPSVREGWSRGELMSGAREIEIIRPIPEEYIKNITPSREIIRNVLPERGWDDLTDVMNRF